MERILISTSINGIQNQLNYLVNKEFGSYIKAYGKSFLILIAITIIGLGFALLTNTASLITLKAIIIFFLGIVWTVVVIFLIILLLKWQHRVRWKNKRLKSLTLDPTKYYLTYDNEKLEILSDTFKSEMKWSHFLYYSENSQTLFIYHKGSIYDALVFSVSEIGEEHLTQLKKIAFLKLKPFPNI